MASVVFFLGLLAAGVVWFLVFGVPYTKYINQKLVLKTWEEENFRRRVAEQTPKPPEPSYDVKGVGILAALLLSVFVLALPSGMVYVPPMSVGVLENTAKGTLDRLDPGLYVFPFNTWKVLPFITHVTIYDVRRHTIEIGEPDQKAKVPEGKSPTQAFGVASASNSPGQPIVYFYAKGWSYPNPECITELHRQWGTDYINKWVESQWITALKNVQRVNPYDHIRKEPLAMQAEVEAALQTQLMNATGTLCQDKPLVFVSQLAILDYDYDSAVNTYLDDISHKQFEQQVAVQQKTLNENQQAADIIKVQTTYSVTLRTAEAEAARAKAEADGQAYATRVRAEADAYQVTQRYQAEANGIQLVMSQLSQPSGDRYNMYKQITQWNGVLPQYQFGNSGVLPFVNIPLAGSK